LKPYPGKPAVWLFERVQEIAQGGVLRHRQSKEAANGATVHRYYGTCSLLDNLGFLKKLILRAGGVFKTGSDPTVTPRPMVGSFGMGEAVSDLRDAVSCRGCWDPQPFSVGLGLVRYALGSIGDLCTDDRSVKHRRETARKIIPLAPDHPSRSHAILGPIAVHPNKLSVGFSAWGIQAGLYSVSRDSSDEIDPISNGIHALFLSANEAIA